MISHGRNDEFVLLLFAYVKANENNKKKNEAKRWEENGWHCKTITFIVFKSYKMNFRQKHFE